MENVERYEAGRGTFLPTIQRSSSQGRHHTVVSAQGSLHAQSRCAPCTQDGSQKEMAALQRNYESMSSIVQLCQQELSQAQRDLGAERDARSKLENNLAQRLASHSKVTAELAEATAALKQKETIELDLQRFQVQNQELRTSIDRLSQDLIDAAHKLEEEQKRTRLLRQSDSHQNTVCLGLQQKLDKATKAQCLLEEQTACLEAEVHNMRKLLVSATDTAQLLQEEKGELQAASEKHQLARSQGVVELEGLRSTIASHDAAKAALEAQIEAAQERGMLLERQLGMKTADCDAAHAHLDHSKSEAASLRATGRNTSQELARVQKQAATLMAQVADLGENLDSARAASSSTGDDLQSALSELTATRAMLAAAQREVQELQQQARAAEQAHRSSLAAAERSLLDCKERLMQERRVRTQATRDQHRLVQRAEQKAAAMADKLLGVLQHQQASMDSAFLDLQQQVSCWVASLSQIQAVQSKAQVDADTCRQTIQRQLGLQLSCVQQATAEQVASWQERAGKAELRLAAQGKEHEQAAALQSKRYADALAEQHERFAAKLQALQSALNELKATSATDSGAWSQRLQSEMASQRQQNEAIRAAMQEDAKQLQHERDVAHGQLTVLSKQHQAVLRQREEEHHSKLDVAMGAAQVAEGELAEVLATLCGILADAQRAEAALAEGSPTTTQALDQCCGGAEAVGKGASGRLVLKQLHQTVSRVAAACQGIKRDPPPPRTSSRLILPEFSDQERTLRATLDKLVQAEESLECNYTCMRCVSIFDDPVVCVPCGHCYCRGCWQGSDAAQQRCHECHQHIERVIPASNLDRLASKFEFKLQALQDMQRMCAGTLVTVTS